MHPSSQAMSFGPRKTSFPALYRCMIRMMIHDRSRDVIFCYKFIVIIEIHDKEPLEISRGQDVLHRHWNDYVTLAPLVSCVILSHVSHASSWCTFYVKRRQTRISGEIISRLTSRRRLSVHHHHKSWRRKRGSSRPNWNSLHVSNPFLSFFPFNVRKEHFPRIRVSFDYKNFSLIESIEQQTSLGPFIAFTSMIQSIDWVSWFIHPLISGTGIQKSSSRNKGNERRHCSGWLQHYAGMDEVKSQWLTNWFLVRKGSVSVGLILIRKRLISHSGRDEMAFSWKGFLNYSKTLPRNWYATAKCASSSNLLGM